MKEIDPDELSGEQEYELRAAFGDEAVDNGEIVELEVGEDLVEPTETYYPMAEQLEVGDHVVIGSKRHDDQIASGVIEEMNGYSMTLDLDDGQTGSSYYGFNGFGGERGTMFTIESVNGEDVDVEYGEVEVDG